ncbi:hypothetical protein [Nostoc sp. TCL26-01]|uniref:hypothetical protein n=1 Tax=Nostoc sp. TCL26-01 TaxID=2576904 RepID=UPI0015C00B37|nr:hypothetical protein [Nostoc sp. TCL26-01]QLE55660.1 hypothetical protein FD725_09105 [Nostoc sp. TCL26-01]
MAEPTLIEVFGTGATQDATTLTIQKSALATVGLTVAATNKPEALLTAIVKLGAVSLTSTNRDSNIDQSITIDADNTPSFTTRINGTTTATYIRDTISIELDKPYSSTGIDPDDY